MTGILRLTKQTIVFQELKAKVKALIKARAATLRTKPPRVMGNKAVFLKHKRAHPGVLLGSRDSFLLKVELDAVAPPASRGRCGDEAMTHGGGGADDTHTQ